MKTALIAAALLLVSATGVSAQLLGIYNFEFQGRRPVIGTFDFYSDGNVNGLLILGWDKIANAPQALVLGGTFTEQTGYGTIDTAVTLPQVEGRCLDPKCHYTFTFISNSDGTILNVETGLGLPQMSGMAVKQ